MDLAQASLRRRLRTGASAGSAADDAGPYDDILELQRTAGNDAVVRMLQREEDTEAAGGEGAGRGVYPAYASFPGSVSVWGNTNVGALLNASSVHAGNISTPLLRAGTLQAGGVTADALVDVGAARVLGGGVTAGTGLEVGGTLRAAAVVADEVESGDERSGGAASGGALPGPTAAPGGAEVEQFDELDVGGALSVGGELHVERGVAAGTGINATSAGARSQLRAERLYAETAQVGSAGVTSGAVVRVAGDLVCDGAVTAPHVRAAHIERPEEPPPPGHDEDPEELRRGARGPKVAELQQQLNAFGASVAVDGAFGPATEHAVSKVQQQHGLRPTGVVDGPTRDLLAAGPGQEVGPAGGSEVGDEVAPGQARNVHAPEASETFDQSR